MYSSQVSHDGAVQTLVLSRACHSYRIVDGNDGVVKEGEGSREESGWVICMHAS